MSHHQQFVRLMENCRVAFLSRSCRIASSVRRRERGSIMASEAKTDVNHDLVVYVLQRDIGCREVR